MPAAYGYLEPCDLTLPHLPDRLVGSRIAHISDIHAWRPSHRWTRLAHQLSGLRLDLVLFTGDYAMRYRCEDTAFSALKQLTDNLRPAIGCFGVFGNHDPAALRQMARELPVRWLANESVKLDNAPLEIFGIDNAREPVHDVLSLLMNRPDDDNAEPSTSKPRPLRLCLCHYPDLLMTAADLGCDLMFSGHTHGGQCRLPTGRALVNCSALPLRHTSGILRHRRMLVGISRGCGSGPMPPRVFCPPHVPIYTLHRGPMSGKDTDGMDNIQPW